MKEYLLDKKHFNKGDWNFCITCRKGWDIPFDFTLMDDCIMNKCLPEGMEGDGFEFISVVTREGFTPDNLWVEADCKFESFGAPSIVFSGDWFKNDDGVNVYRRHYELCGYEKGLNIWDVENDNGTMVVRSVAKTLFHVPRNEKFTIRGEFDKGTLKTGIGNFSVQIPFKCPDKIHIGFTAFEGINSFYSFRYGKLREE